MADPKLTRLADQVAARYGIPKNLFRALIRQESGWNPRAGSPAGAQGLTQLMPATARGLGVTDPFDPQQSLDGGARYLRDQYKRFGKWDLALSAYNSGPGGAESAGRVEGFPETQNYVKAILGSLTSGGAGRLGTEGAGAQRAAAPLGALGRAPSPPAGLSAATRNLIFADDPDLAATLGRIAAGRSPAPTVRPGRSGGALRQLHAEFGPVAVKAVERLAARPGGNDKWGGSQGVARQIANVGLGFGLNVTSEKRDRQNTKSGGVSDHWTGSKNAYAYDLGGPVASMDKAAAQILRRLGVNWDGKSGVYVNKNVNGYRVQVIYRSNVGGNHFNHIHIGVRREK